MIRGEWSDGFTTLTAYTNFSQTGGLQLLLDDILLVFDSGEDTDESSAELDDNDPYINESESDDDDN